MRGSGFRWPALLLTSLLASATAAVAVGDAFTPAGTSAGATAADQTTGGETSGSVSPAVPRKPKTSSSPRTGGGGGPLGAAPSSPAPIPAGTGFPGTIILGKPTATSATVSLLSATALDVYVEHGGTSGRYSARTTTARSTAGQPLELTLTGLAPDSAVFYRVRYRAAGRATFSAAVQQSFRTQRAATSTFTFAVEADPHIDVDRKTQPALLRQELANVVAGRPDFLVDLGDTFLGDKFAASYPDLVKQYVNVRSYLGIAGPSVPVFLVNGNHEGEDGWALDGTADNLSVWAANARKTYYPEPSSGAFYSTSAEREPFVGERDSYYAWTWGDARFIVLDPYAYTTTDPRASGDAWDWTLGEAQYRWLVHELSTNAASYTFVFAHHIIGDVRGGVEWTDLYEWGGHDRSGADRFAVERPGWGLPIHDLFVKYGVTIFFQGHDHLFVRQEADGVVYQEVPQPATPGGDAANQAHENAYASGVILPSTGHLEVTVAAAGVTVDYIRSSVTSSGAAGPDNGVLGYTYTLVKPSGQ